MPPYPATEPLAEMSSLADGLPVGICLIDDQCRLVLWNRTLERWTGQSCEDVLNYCLYDLFPNLNQPAIREAIGRVFSHGEPVLLSETEQFHFIPTLTTTAAGEQLMVQRTTVQPHGSDGTMAVIAIEDRTTSLSQRPATPLAAVREEPFSDQYAEFIAHMGKVLRSPLNTILGYAEFLREQETLPERRAALDGLRRNGEMLMTVLNDSLDFAKIAAQQVRVDPIRVELGPLLRDIVSLIRLAAAEKRLHFAFEYESHVPVTIRTDPTRLRQILLSLLSNALAFTSEGEVRLSVRMSQESDVDHLQFEVTDTGVGISPQRLAHLFEPFRQTEENPNAPRGHGSGLGLAISQRLARLLEGRLEVSSELQVGTTFTLTLPLNEG